MQLTKLFNKGKAKEDQKKPVDIATDIITKVTLGDMIASCNATGGFVNVTLTREFIMAEIVRLLAAGRPAPPSTPHKVIAVDFSSPNIAKPLHVGHLRSTIIGDTICRLYEYCLGLPEGGESCGVKDWSVEDRTNKDAPEVTKVHRINHVGDWGTQFGMLIAQLKLEAPNFREEMPDIGDLVKFYKRAKAHFDEDVDFKEEARATVVKLQARNEEEFTAWQKICELSRGDFQVLYDQLSVNLNECGESFYNDLIPEVIQKMQDAGLAEEDDGALCCWPEGRADPDAKGKKTKKPVIPLILRKRDGGYGYDSTDMAAIYYRTQVLGADKLVYTTDFGQGPHFDLVFKAAEKMGWVNQAKTDPQGIHVGFGLVKDANGQKFKTRSGDTVGLKLLLDEAVAKVQGILEERSADRMDTDEIRTTAEKVGIAAVKYADLASQRTKDYVFSFDKMLNLKGNTAVYLLYAFARINSIMGKAGVTREALLEHPEALQVSDVPAEADAELALMLHIARFQEDIEMTLRDLFPHRLCDYLYNLSVKVSDFYEKCRVIVDDPAVRQSRLRMLLAAQMTMKTCFDILGIHAPGRADDHEDVL